MFYIFDQNNSGGYWTGPALHVIVEADSPEEANHNAQFVGVYFDDEYQIDCSCCGPRWSRQWDNPYYSDAYQTLEEAIKEADRDSIVGNDGFPNYHVLRKGVEV